MNTFEKCKKYFCKPPPLSWIVRFSLNVTIGRVSRRVVLQAVSAARKWYATRRQADPCSVCIA